LLANVGGVTCSYFEWLKNLDHVSPGRMKKRYSEKRKTELLSMLGYKIPEDSPLRKKMEGAKEIDIVYAALEDMMIEATNENW
jgi:glutamate dehydrogenase (NAD(P)+)